MPFSSPLGIPMDRIFFIIWRSGIRNFQLLRRMVLFRFCIRTNIIKAAVTRLMRVGQATPATPILRPNTQIAFPIMLIIFMTKEVIMDTFELPMERNRAAQAL